MMEQIEIGTSELRPLVSWDVQELYRAMWRDAVYCVREGRRAKQRLEIVFSHENKQEILKLDEEGKNTLEVAEIMTNRGFPMSNLEVGAVIRGESPGSMWWKELVVEGVETWRWIQGEETGGITFEQVAAGLGVGVETLRALTLKKIGEECENNFA